MKKDLVRGVSSSSIGSAKDRAFGVIVLGLCSMILGWWMLSEPIAAPIGEGRYAWLHDWIRITFGPYGQAWGAIAIGTLIAAGGAVWLLRTRKGKV